MFLSATMNLEEMNSMSSSSVISDYANKAFTGAKGMTNHQFSLSQRSSPDTKSATFASITTSTTTNNDTAVLRYRALTVFLQHWMLDSTTISINWNHDLKTTLRLEARLNQLRRYLCENYLQALQRDKKRMSSKPVIQLENVYNEFLTLLNRNDRPVSMDFNEHLIQLLTEDLLRLSVQDLLEQYQCNKEESRETPNNTFYSVLGELYKQYFLPITAGLQFQALSYLQEVLTLTEDVRQQTLSLLSPHNLSDLASAGDISSYDNLTMLIIERIVIYQRWYDNCWSLLDFTLFQFAMLPLRMLRQEIEDEFLREDILIAYHEIQVQISQYHQVLKSKHTLSDIDLKDTDDGTVGQTHSMTLETITSPTNDDPILDNIDDQRFIIEEEHLYTTLITKVKQKILRFLHAASSKRYSILANTEDPQQQPFDDDYGEFFLHEIGSLHILRLKSELQSSYHLLRRGLRDGLHLLHYCQREKVLSLQYYNQRKRNRMISWISNMHVSIIRRKTKTGKSIHWLQDGLRDILQCKRLCECLLDEVCRFDWFAVDGIAVEDGFEEDNGMDNMNSNENNVESNGTIRDDSIEEDDDDESCFNDHDDEYQRHIHKCRSKEITCSLLLYLQSDIDVNCLHENTSGIYPSEILSDSFSICKSDSFLSLIQCSAAFEWSHFNGMISDDVDDSNSNIKLSTSQLYLLKHACYEALSECLYAKLSTMDVMLNPHTQRFAWRESSNNDNMSNDHLIFLTDEAVFAAKSALSIASTLTIQGNSFTTSTYYQDHLDLIQYNLYYVKVALQLATRYHSYRCPQYDERIVNDHSRRKNRIETEYLLYFFDLLCVIKKAIEWKQSIILELCKNASTNTSYRYCNSEVERSFMQLGSSLAIDYHEMFSSLFDGKDIGCLATSYYFQCHRIKEEIDCLQRLEVMKIKLRLWKDLVANIHEMVDRSRISNSKVHTTESINEVNEVSVKHVNFFDTKVKEIMLKVDHYRKTLKEISELELKAPKTTLLVDLQRILSDASIVNETCLDEYDEYDRVDDGGAYF